MQRSGAFGKNAGVVPCVIEQAEQRRGMDGAEDGALVGVKQSDGQVGGAGHISPALSSHSRS